MKYKLYRYTSSGLKMYKGDRPSTLPTVAYEYDMSTAFGAALRGEWFVEEVDESPPALSIHIQDGMGSQDKVGG